MRTILPSLLSFITAASLVTPRVAGAQTPQPEPSGVSARPQPAASPQGDVIPRVSHAPTSVSTAHANFEVRADILHAHRVRRAIVVYRTAAKEDVREIEFRRASRGPYIAIVPATEVVYPWLEYSIELETVEGTRLEAFASRKTMFRVSVPEDIGDLRERTALARLDGRRSVVFASGEYVHFGTTDAALVDPVTGAPELKGIRDEYYRVEGGYTYRPLGFISEFSLRLGVVRGRSVVPNETDESKLDVGLNYGAPTVQFRVQDNIHLEAELLTSVTEVGFSTGAGGAVLIGDPLGSKVTFGFETIQTFGTRFYSRMDLAAHPRFIIAPIIEVTDMPHADRFGVRLLAEARVALGAGFSLAGRGGYQARTFTSGGASGGATAAYEF